MLTDPRGKHGGWDADTFFATGEQEVDAMLATAAQFGLPAGREWALDFGCGPGRLTRALARHFDNVVGVDISPPLVERARQLNADVPTCEFRVNDSATLRAFTDASFDLVYSTIVLQHQPSRRVIRRYLAEFIRVARPGGLVVFQLPTSMPLRNRLQPRRRAYALLRRLGLSPDLLYRRLRLDPMRMTSMPEHRVVAAVEHCGGRLAQARADRFGGAFPSATYFVTRPAARRAATR